MDSICKVQYRNHEVLEQFIENTEKDDSYLTNSVKATMAQFLLDLKTTIQKQYKDSDWTIDREKVLSLQIETLRNCIIDLQGCLNHITTKEVIQ